MAPEQPMAAARWMSVAWPVYRPVGDLVRFEEEPLGVAGAVLDAGHGELAEHVDGDARRRHLRVVVGEHGDVDGRRDALVVRPRIGDAGGGEDEQRVGAVARSPARQQHGLPGRRGTGAGEHRHPSVDGRSDGDQEVAALLVVEGGRLAGGTGDDHRLDARIDQPGGVVGRRRGVDLTFLVEEGDEGDADARERSRSGHGRQPNE